MAEDFNKTLPLAGCEGHKELQLQGYEQTPKTQQTFTTILDLGEACGSEGTRQMPRGKRRKENHPAKSYYKRWPL